MYLKNKLSLVLMLILLFCAAFVWAEEGVVVDVEGESMIMADELQAKEMAVTDALRRAVEQVVGTLVDSRTDTKNYQLIQDTIKIKSTGYVAKYDVLKAYKEDGFYKVKVRATVKRDAVKQDVDALKITIAQAGKPRVMVIIDEQSKGGGSSQVAEPEITRVLMANGFPMVDQTLVQKARDGGLTGRVMTGDRQASSRLASEYKAEILVIGKASGEMLGDFQGLISCQVTLEIRAVRANTGQTLASNSFSEKGVDIAEGAAFKKGLIKASNRAAEYLKGELGKQLTEANRSVQVVVSGISYSDLQTVQKLLKATPAVNNVFLRDFSGGVAQLDVETGLLANQLADQIANWSGITLEITGLADSKVEATKDR